MEAQTLRRNAMADPNATIPRRGQKGKALAKRLPMLIEPDDILRGARGTYHVERELGSGGMARVYKARHIDSNFPVAIKIASEPRFDTFIRKELKALTEVQHENIVTVYDGGVFAFHRFIVMEFLEGSDLYSYMYRARLASATPVLSPDAAVAITIQVLSGLEAVHLAGRVHADVKSANVFITESSDSARVKILDFGLSGTISECVGSKYRLGTAGYMAPEQAAARPFDQKSDIYAVGVLLYTMLAGAEPFSGSESQIIAQTILSAPPPLETKCGNLPIALLNIVKKAMEKDPSKRFRNVAEFREQLERILAVLDGRAQ